MTSVDVRAREYDFTLVLDGITYEDDAQWGEVERRLFEAGCDDATLSLRQGRPFMTFSRAAESLKDAVLSAVAAIQNAQCGAWVVRVDDCLLVTQADIARRLGRPRQAVHQFVTGERGPGGFPAPACNLTEDAPLWRWCEVAYWCYEAGMIREGEYLEAEFLRVINSVLEMNNACRMNRDLATEIRKALEFACP